MRTISLLFLGLGVLLAPFNTLVWGKSNKTSKNLSPQELIRNLNSTDFVKQSQAKNELRAYRFKDIARSMSQYAKDPNPEIRILMAQTLGELGGFEAAKSLKKLFYKEKETQVRRAILIQLSGLLPNEKDALSFFKKIVFSDPNEDLRSLSLSQLSLLGSSSENQKKLLKIYKKVWKKDPHRPNKIFAAVLLREAGAEGPDLEGASFEALKSPAVELRRRAALLLGTVGKDQNFNRIAISAQDPDFEVRANICKSLGESKNSSAIPILKSLANDKEPLVRKSALGALNNFTIKETGLNIFIAGLEDTDPSVRSLVVTLLEKMEEASIIPHLKKISEIDPDPKIRHLAKKALATLSGKKPSSSSD